MDMNRLTFAIKTTICFLLAALMLPFSFGCSDLTAQGNLVINEVVTSNDSSLVDEVYGTPDWIELYNDSNRQIDLGNYLITDNVQNADKTVLLPKRILEPHEYIIIFASKTIDVNSLSLSDSVNGAICVDFGLSKAGDTLVIADANYNVIQELAIPALDKDISYARSKDGSYGFCAIPTPKTENISKLYLSLDEAKAAMNDDAATPTEPVNSSIYINEIVAKNSTSLEHSGCADCDWVELYNDSDQDISLDGYYFADKEYEKGKSNLNGYTIAAHGYFLICCCTDDCDNTDGHCCIRMGISRYGERVYLFDSIGRTVISFDSPLLETDISYARRADGTYGYCSRPTPNAENTTDIVDSFAPADMDTSDPVRINEVLPKNKYSLVDADGDRSDWVELYNYNSFEVSLAGYYLSDDPNDLYKWAFPNVDIPANGYLIVFLSGKETKENELHANFSLGGNDTGLILFDSNKNKTDIIALCDTDSNVSIGRASDGSLEYYRQPTPYAPNAHAYSQADAIGFFQTDGVYISEVSASHAKGTGDNDWIELYNGYSATLDLNGYYLSDDIDDMFKWQIKNVSIEAGGYKAIEATSHVTRQGEGVATFGIAASGDTLFLSDPNGFLVDVFDTGALDVGMSSGRIVGDATISRVFFDTPTRGKSNSNIVYVGYTAQPILSQTGLYQTDGFSLELTCNTPNAVIYYTTNGSIPTSSSKVYNEAIAISKSTVVRAVAHIDGLVDSPIVTYHYLFVEPHTVPVMCIAMNKDDFTTVYSVTQHSDIVEREAYFSYYEDDGKLGVTFPAGVKAKGRGTLLYAQKSLAIHLRGSYGQNSVNYPFFDEIKFTEFASLVLRNGGQDYDAARIRDSYISRAVQGLNIETAATRPVVVYVNGEYYGLYDLNEDLNADYLQTHYGADPDAVDQIMRNQTATQGSKTEFLRVREFAREANMSNSEVYEQFCQWVDVDYFTDYIIVQSYTANSDMFNQKYWRTQDYSIKWRPIFYDLDFCFKSSTRNMIHSYFTVDGVPSANGSKSNMDIYCALKRNQGWCDRFVERYVEVVMTYFDADRMTNILDDMVAQLEPEMKRHIARWGKPSSYSKWESSVASLRKIVQNRQKNALNYLQDYFNVSDSLMNEYIKKYGG